MNQLVIDKAIEYKRKVAGSFLTITQEDINTKIPGDELIVTTKIDGEYNLLYFDGETSTLINSGGNIKTGIPILNTVSEQLKSKQVKSLLITVELHIKNNRSRVFEVMKAIKSNKDLLTISAFDIIEINGERYIGSYDETLDKLSQLLNENVVEAKSLNKAELEDYFSQKVTVEGHEGLIVRSKEYPIVFKLKPLHSLDLAIIGYSYENNMVREILVATLDENDNFIQVGVVGNGLNESFQKKLYTELSKNHIDSSYIEVDKRRVAFQMVNPEIVVEVTANELLTENTKGIIKKPYIKLDEKKGYQLKSMIPFISLIHPIIKRVRYDKSVNSHDVRNSQITDVIYLEETIICQIELPKSKVIFREVYTKESKGMTNVKKFLIYKTNKEDIDCNYPAYVFHYTDFSASRKEPIKKEIRISNSKEQIESLCRDFIKDEIKKGWNKI